MAWCEETVAKLKARQLDALDIDSLIEEIEGLANRDRKELESRLRILLAHLFKRLYVISANDYRGWENTIDEQRSELELLLKHSPSLRNYLQYLMMLGNTFGASPQKLSSNSVSRSVAV